MCIQLDNACGKCLALFLFAVFSFSILALLSMDSGFQEKSFSSEPPLVLENDWLPLISADKKTIYVASEQGLPIANNFVIRNPSIPVNKIVFKKPGANNSIHVYPIQREALLKHPSPLNPAVYPCAAVLVLGALATVSFILMYCQLLPHQLVFSCRDCETLDPDDEYYNGESPDTSPFGSPLKPKKSNLTGKTHGHSQKAKKCACGDKGNKELEELLIV